MYNPKEIEKKWQDFWEKNKTFKTLNPWENWFDETKEKFYVLDMFPYPSGAWLHVWHPEGYTANDILARYKKMKFTCRKLRNKNRNSSKNHYKSKYWCLYKTNKKFVIFLWLGQRNRHNRSGLLQMDTMDFFKNVWSRIGLRTRFTDKLLS